MRLGLAIVASRLDVLQMSVPKMLPHFDDVFVVVDGIKGEPGLREWVVDSGFRWVTAHFSHRADVCFNLASAGCVADWIYQHDSDEMLTGVENLKTVATEASRQGAPVVAIPRRHWRDLEMTRPVEGIEYPDHQVRLRHIGVRNRWRVHPELDLAPNIPTAFVPEDGRLLCIEHFNFALRTKAEHEAIGRDYKAMLDADYADGRKRWEGDSERARFA